MWRKLFAAAAAIGVACATVVLARPEASTWSESELETLRSLSFAAPLRPPSDPSNRYADDERAAALGHALFFDAGLSANGRVSCSSCHQPRRNFQDGRHIGRGLGVTTRRTMAIVGAAHNTWFFWDGRKDSLWSQALGPLENRAEHGLTRGQVVRFVGRHYRREYESAFGRLDAHDVNRAFANVGKAIAAYERRLRLGRARFDDYVEAALAGDEGRMRQSLTEQEVAGLRLFIGAAHCIDCHNGPLLTNGEFHNTGVPPVRGRKPDEGRLAALATLRSDQFNCIGRFSDARSEDCALRFLAKQARLRGAFKPPSLRNVTRNAPYMHAGQFATVRDVLRHYNRAPGAAVGRTELHALGLGEEELRTLEAFLATLESPVVAPPGFLAPPR